MLKVLSLFVVAVTTQDCKNPVFQDVGQWGGTSQLPIALALAGTPVPYPAGKDVCQYFKTHHRDAQCCTADTLDTISTVFDAANQALQTAKDAIDNDPFTNDLVKTIQTAIDVTCAIPGVLCPKNIKETLKSYTQKLADASTQLQSSQVDCVAVQLAYTQGMVCFACEADFSQYLNTTGKIITLAQDVCDGVVSGCQPVYSGVKNIVKVATDFIQEIVKDVTGIGPLVDLCKVPDMCGGTFCNEGDCSQFTCHDMLNGFSVPSYAWGAKANAQGLRGAVGRTRSLSFDLKDKTHEEAKDLFSSHMLALHDELLGVLAAKAPSKVSKVNVGVKAVADHNSYAKSGYNALAVGCSDVSCPGHFPAYAIVLIVAACLAVVAGGAFWIYRRRKAADDSLRMPFAAEEATSNYQAA